MGDRIAIHEDSALKVNSPATCHRTFNSLRLTSGRQAHFAGCRQDRQQSLRVGLLVCLTHDISLTLSYTLVKESEFKFSVSGSSLQEES